jgi:hypothetical protein
MNSDSRILQRKIEKMLRESSAHFEQEVVYEWSITKEATDSLGWDDERYSPRLDVAVYTKGSKSGKCFEEIDRFWNAHAPQTLKAKFHDRRQNQNPRCALAIEVVHSGSPKEILGNLLNASVLGLYGTIVFTPTMGRRVRRVMNYIDTIKKLEKVHEGLFGNVHAMPEQEFLDLLSRDRLVTS